jgi:hypothetical protein
LKAAYICSIGTRNKKALMKSLVFSLLVIGSLLAACKDFPCDRAAPQMGFISFTPAETDTVIVRRFNKASGFATVVDSFLVDSANAVYLSSAGNLLIIHQFGGAHGLSSEYDYQIFIPATGRTYQITEMVEVFMSSGKTGIFSMDKQACTNAITSYKLDGQLVTGKANYSVLYMQR